MPEKFTKEWFKEQGSKGGKKRMAMLTKAEKSALGKKAARAKKSKGA